MFSENRLVKKHSYEFVASGNGFHIKDGLNGTQYSVIDSDRVFYPTAISTTPASAIATGVGNTVDATTVTTGTGLRIKISKTAMTAAGSALDVYDDDSSSVVFRINEEGDIISTNTGSNPDFQQTNASATADGVIHEYYQQSASPAGNDVIFAQKLYGNDDGANKTEYVRLEAILDNAADGAEAAHYEISAMVSGSLTEIGRFDANGLSLGASLGFTGNTLNLTANSNQIVLDSDDGSGFTTTITDSATAARVLTLPDETDTLATQGYVTSAVGAISVTLQDAFDGGQTITIANNDNQTLTINQGDITNNPNAFAINNAGTGNDLVLINGAAGSNGVTIYTDHNSTSPASSDVIAEWRAFGRDDGANTTEYGKIEFLIQSETDGSEAGEIRFNVEAFGFGLQQEMSITPSQVTVNNGFVVSGQSYFYNNALFQNSDEGSTGPIVNLTHFTSTPAANDETGTLNFNSYNDNTPQDQIAFGSIQGKIQDPTSAAEIGSLHLSVYDAGALTEYFVVNGSTQTVRSNVSFESYSSHSGNSGAEIHLYHESSSPAISDDVGIIRFYGESNADTKREYGKIDVEIVSVTDGSEDAKMNFNIMDQGTLRSALELNQTGGAYSAIFGDGTLTPTLSGGGSTGIILAGAAGKLGFFGATPVVQQSGTGEATGFVAGSGTGVNDDSTFTGNVGSTTYRINDVIKALKNLGLLAS